MTSPYGAISTPSEDSGSGGSAQDCCEVAANITNATTSSVTRVRRFEAIDIPWPMVVGAAITRPRDRNLNFKFMLACAEPQRLSMVALNRNRAPMPSGI
jgi:hypothetical protein